jgi:hypothetical protein
VDAFRRALLYTAVDVSNRPAPPAPTNERTRRRAPGKSKPRGQRHKTAIDNVPPPLGLSDESFHALANALWVEDGKLPAQIQCEWEGCVNMVSTAPGKIPEHLRMKHGIPCSQHKSVHCGWPGCSSKIQSHNIRMHILGPHKNLTGGRCRKCGSWMRGSTGLQRHLKGCLLSLNDKVGLRAFGVAILESGEVITLPAAATGSEGLGGSSGSEDPQIGTQPSLIGTLHF